MIQHRNKLLIISILVTMNLTGLLVWEVGSSESDPPQLTPVWSQVFPEKITRFAVSPDGEFVGVISIGKVSVLDKSGKEIWNFEAQKVSPYLKYGELNYVPLAVGPGGRWVVIAGDPSYRYIWKVDREGPRWYHKTTGTPRSIAVTRAGDRIAVGTAGGHLYLLRPDGKLLKDISIEYGLIEKLMCSDDDKHLVLCSIFKNGVSTRNGDLQWLKSGWWSIFPSRNLQIFGALDQAGHGPPGSMVAMLNEKGEQLWSRRLWYGDIRIAPSGEYAAISGVPMESPVWPDSPDPALVSLVDQKGHTLKERSMSYPILGFIANDNQTIAVFFNNRNNLIGFNRNLEPVWQIVPADWPEGSMIYFAPNLFMYIKNTLSMYRIPEAAEKKTR